MTPDLPLWVQDEKRESLEQETWREIEGMEIKNQNWGNGEETSNMETETEREIDITIDMM